MKKAVSRGDVEGTQGEGDQNLVPGDGAMERTLAIIKPDAMIHSEEIINIIRKEGFCILQVMNENYEKICNVNVNSCVFI